MSECKRTKWTVVTGAPSSGKTSILRALALQQYNIRAETGTLYIKAELTAGKTLEQICSDQAALQRAIIDTSVRMDKELDPEERYFLDRGVPDPLAYCKLYDIDNAYFLEQARQWKYQRIFLLDRLPFKPNHVRIENDATAAIIDRYLEEVYRDLGYDVIRVPVMSIDQRMDFLLSYLP